jgi:hypothetical protein
MRMAILMLACALALVLLDAPSAWSRAQSHAQPGAASSTFVRLAGETAPTDASGKRTSFAPTAAERRSRLTITVVLKRSDEAGFQSYLRAVENGASSRYRRYLTPAQQAARFGPSGSTYTQTERWLRARGLALVQGSADRLSLTVRGTRAAAERAFRTPIRDLRGKLYANVRAPAVPRRLAPHWQAVMGLANLAQPVAAPSDQHLCENSKSLAKTPGNEKFIETCGNLCRAYAERTLPGSYAELIFEIFLAFLPPVFSLANTAVNHANGAWGLVGYCFGAAAAGAFSGFGGGGSGEHSARLPAAHAGVKPLVGAAARQKIGLLEFDTYRPTDVTDWLNLEGIPPTLAAHLSEVNVNGGLATPGAGESEVLLDIDTVIGAAPFSDYVVYDAPASTSFVQMFQTMIADGDTVISNSWSQCEDQTPSADAQAIDSVLAGAAASGITVVNGTGDGGSTCLDGSANTIGVPADSPHATAVGGTTPNFGPGLTYGSESWWNEQEADPPGGAGGYGVSRYFARPSYQSPFTSSTMRSVPDISFIADPHAGVSLCQADSGGCPDGQLWGGTSMAAPGVAALVADVNEELGHDVGDLNAALYPLAGTSALHSPASMASDFAHVGLGSPDFEALYEQLSGTAIGPVSGSTSSAGGVGQPQGDGAQDGLVRVNLEDAGGRPVGGKQVTLTPSAGSEATISPSSATTDATDGAAVFTVTDTKAQTVSFTVTDTSDGVALSDHPKLTFQTPVATGSSITATPRTVVDNGSAQATISVYLQNELGRPAVGKTVRLSGGGSALITPSSAEVVTNAEGVATFTAIDSAEESIGFSATDVSDNDLQVPGAALVNFQPEGVASCADTLPAPVSGSTITLAPFATELPDNSQGFETYYEGIRFVGGACRGTAPPTFDAAGNVFVADAVNGEIYEFGPAGGVAGPATALPDSVPGLIAIAFGKHGELYATLYHEGNLNQPELVELDPASGAIVRVIATAAGGLQHFPNYLAIDPISGDVFVVDDGGGAGTEHFSVTRVANPESSSPTLSDYANVEGVQTALSFAPDGTLYVGVVSGPHGSSIVSISATNSGSPGTVSAVATLPVEPFGVALAEANAQGHATTLDAVDDEGSIYRIDLTQAPATVQKLATSDVFSQGAAIGPDGCLYYADQDLLLKATGVSSKCAAGGGGATAHITLSGGGLAGASAGSSVSFAATLGDVEAPQGIPIHLLVTGADSLEKLVDADGGGTSSFTYTGVSTGADTVSAFAEVNGQLIRSAPITFRWSGGRDTSFLSLNASQGGGPLGQPATLRVSLFDVSTEPPSPIADASVTLSLAAQSCTASTDAAGNAACQVTPPGGLGLDAVSAAYAGSSAYTPSTASDVFDAGAIGLPAQPQLGPAKGPVGSAPAVPIPHKVSAQPANLCGAVNVDLLDVYLSGGRVRLLGYANPRLAGKSVSIQSTWNKQLVARSKVAPSGYFTATAKAPPLALRASNRTRYRASVAGYRSPALKLSRRLNVFTIAPAARGRVRIVGQILEPLADPPAALVVTRRDSCQSGYRKLKATVKLSRATGKFTVLAPAPPASAPGAVYRLQTRVRIDTHSRRSFFTASLPRVVGH